LHDTENHSKMSHPLKRAIPFTVDVWEIKYLQHLLSIILQIQF
jgi:hypothetical protein